MPAQRIVVYFRDSVMARTGSLTLFRWLYHVCLGLGIGHMLGGAVVVENIFSIPGLGSFLSLSISRRDYPVIQAYILLMTAVFLLINFAADTVTVLLDPRIRLKGTMKG